MLEIQNVPLLDLRRQYSTIQGDVEEAVKRVFDSQVFIMGPEVEAFEKEVAAYCGVSFAVGVSSGTDAILMALMAADVGPGDEVITTPYTFFATVGCIARLGATPVFVDIDPETYNLNPDLIEAKITKATKAIIPVHLFGQMVEMRPIMDVAERYGLVVIEDAAQAIGSEIDGKRAGSFGHYGCFSFFPSKNLGGAGDGGLVTTNNASLAEKLKALRNHGQEKKYYHRYVGGNFRLDSLQAAVLRIKLRHLDSWTVGRQTNAQLYRDLFSAYRLPVSLPVALATHNHIYNQFVIRLSERDEVLAFLRSRGVGCEIYYPVAHHMQECFEYLGYKDGCFPASEKAARETIALPIFPELAPEELRYIVQCVAAFYGAI